MHHCGFCNVFFFDKYEKTRHCASWRHIRNIESSSAELCNMIKDANESMRMDPSNKENCYIRHAVLDTEGSPDARAAHRNVTRNLSVRAARASRRARRITT